MFVASFLQTVLATCDLRSFQRAVRVNPFPPLIWIDMKALGMAWKQFTSDMKAHRKPPALWVEEGKVEPETLAEDWVENVAAAVTTTTTTTTTTTNNTCTCNNETEWIQNQPIREPQEYVHPTPDPTTIHKQEYPLPRINTTLVESQPAMAAEPHFLSTCLCFLLLGAVVSAWFWRRKPTLQEDAPSSLRHVQSKLARLEQRLALLEAHDKIAELESKLQQQQQQQQQRQRAQATTIPSLVAHSHSSHSSSQDQEEEEALLRDRMLAVTVTQDEDSTTHPYDDRDEQEVGLMLEDFQSELEHIQENLRTGNFLLSPTFNS